MFASFGLDSGLNIQGLVAETVAVLLRPDLIFMSCIIHRPECGR